MTRDARLQVFISYRSETAGTARALHAAIEKYANRVGSIFYSESAPIGKPRAERFVAEGFHFAICLNAGGLRRKRKVHNSISDAVFFRDEIVAVIRSANVVALSWLFPLRDMHLCHSCEFLSTDVCDTSQATTISRLLDKSALAIGQDSGQAKCSVLAGFHSERLFRADAARWQGARGVSAAVKPWLWAEYEVRRAAGPGSELPGRRDASTDGGIVGLVGDVKPSADSAIPGMRGDVRLEAPAHPIAAIRYERSCPNRLKADVSVSCDSGRDILVSDHSKSCNVPVIPIIVDDQTAASNSIPLNSIFERHISVGNIDDSQVTKEVNLKGVSSLGVQIEGVRRVLAAEQEAGHISVPTSCEVEQKMLTGRKKNGSLSDRILDAISGAGRSKPESRPASGIVGDNGWRSDEDGVGCEEAAVLARPAGNSDIGAGSKVLPFAPREPAADLDSSLAGDPLNQQNVAGAGNVVELAAVLRERAEVLAEPDALEWPGPGWNGRLTLDSYEDDVRELMELLAEEDSDGPVSDDEPSGSRRPRGC